MSEAVKSRGPQLLLNVTVCGLALRALPELRWERVPRKPQKTEQGGGFCAYEALRRLWWPGGAGFGKGRPSIQAGICVPKPWTTTPLQGRMESLQKDEKEKPSRL